MTMYEDLIKEANNKMLIDNIFKVMTYDKTLQSPSKARRSGKTTYQIILTLNEFLFNEDIKHIRFISVNNFYSKQEERKDTLVYIFFNYKEANRVFKIYTEIIDKLYEEYRPYIFTYKNNIISKIDDYDTINKGINIK